MVKTVNINGFQPIPIETEQVGKAILEAAFKVHTVLGPGLLESVYQKAIAHVLRKSNLLVETQADSLSSLKEKNSNLA